MSQQPENAASELARLRAVFLARSKNILLGAMVSKLVHDINNPLTSINGNIELLQLSPVAGDAKIKKRLDTIQLGTKKIIGRLQGLQLFYKQGRGDAVYELNEVINEVVQAADYLPKLNKTPLIVSSASEPIMVKGNSNQIAQTLLAIVDNAMDAVAHKAGPQITLQTGRQSATEVFISVINNGPAIALEIKDKIFEPFFTTKLDAPGVGLTLADQMVKENSGRIEWQSNNVETRFTILLPA